MLFTELELQTGDVAVNHSTGLKIISTEDGLCAIDQQGTLYWGIYLEKCLTGHDWETLYTVPKYPPHQNQDYVFFYDEVVDYEYPSFLGGAGMTQDKRGQWVLHYHKPRLTKRDWVPLGYHIRLTPHLFPTLQLPSVTDWKKSWIPNPKK